MGAMRPLLVVSLLGLSSCLATEDFVNERDALIDGKVDQSVKNTEDRIDAVDTKATQTTIAVGRSLEGTVPGITAYLQSVLEQYPVPGRKAPIAIPPPPPPADVGQWAWLGNIGGPLGTVAAILLAAVAGYQKTKKDAVKQVNEERDAARETRGEANTVQEAHEKGYFRDEAVETARVAAETDRVPPRFDPKTGKFV